MVNDETGQHSISADDQFLYAYDFARLYVVICIATSDSLQFLFPESTTCGNGITLWNSIITKLFGLTYKDAFEAAEKLRRWTIDPNIRSSSRGSLLIASYIIPNIDVSGKMVFAVSLALLTRSIRLWMSCCRGLVGSIWQCLPQ